MKLTEFAKMGGVNDLPIRIRAQFAKALLEEANGNDELAAEHLEKAIEIESSTSR